jgi:hypothetical protein
MIKRNETLALVANFIVRHRLRRVHFSGRPIYRPKLLGAEIGYANVLNLTDQEGDCDEYFEDFWLYFHLLLSLNNIFINKIRTGWFQCWARNQRNIKNAWGLALTFIKLFDGDPGRRRRTI